MLYHYLSFINYIFTVFGIRKPFTSYMKGSYKGRIWHYVWSITVIAGLIVSHVISAQLNKNDKNNLKKNLHIFYVANVMVINIFIIILNMVNGEKVCIHLYERMQKVVQDFGISEINVKMFALKLYVAFIASTMVAVLFIILDVLEANALICLISLPLYLSTFHLVFHLFLLLAILKLVTLKMSDMISFKRQIQINSFVEKPMNNIVKIKYLLGTDIKFFIIDNIEKVDLKYLCRIYDDLSMCIQLLEQHHGVQMLFTYWLMFTNAVFGITMVVCNNAQYPVLIAARSLVPFLWCFIGSFINDQINKQVDQIDMAIVKCLIDFRCDQTRKAILQTFKQLIGTNRLQFTACGLFHLNYSMILRTIVNIITYSIIMIQLFLSDGD